MSGALARAFRRVVEGESLDAAAMDGAIRAIMSGECAPAQVAGFLVALRMKGESSEEIASAARVLRDLATPVDLAGLGPVTDIVGTGGDGASTFNVSTASAFVLAAAGARVAKHGNRSVSSSSGAADVLELAGARLALAPTEVRALIEQTGFAFLFAPAFHGAMRHAVAVRRELGVRTLFNLLGPLSNPAGAGHGLIGVYARRWVRPMADVLASLGAAHVLVVHAEDGLDELSVAAPGHVAEVRDGDVHEYRVDPSALGVREGALAEARVASPAESLAMLERVLRGQDRGVPTELVALNAGAALYAADQAGDLAAGVRLAREVLASGLAWERLQRYASLSRGKPDVAEK
jgi:anthranilate phosphoribosyltransferase